MKAGQAHSPFGKKVPVETTLHIKIKKNVRYSVQKYVGRSKFMNVKIQMLYTSSL
jgi:hypothetical protein